MPESSPGLYNSFLAPVPPATEAAPGSLCLTPDGPMVSDGNEWTYLEAGSGISLREVSLPYPLLARVTASEKPSLELDATDPAALAMIIGQGLASLIPDVEISVKGACITITSPPAQALTVSVSSTPTEPPLIQVEQVPREQGEAWGDYASRIGAGAPGSDRDDWLARLRARAGE